MKVIPVTESTRYTMSLYSIKPMNSSGSVSTTLDQYPVFVSSLKRLWFRAGRWNSWSCSSYWKAMGNSSCCSSSQEIIRALNHIPSPLADWPRAQVQCYSSTSFNFNYKFTVSHAADTRDFRERRVKIGGRTVGPRRRTSLTDNADRK